MVDSQNLIWVDMEMTGLVPEQHRVIEIATIVTDSDLNELAQGPVIAIHQSDAELAAMDEWNTSHHTASGLVERVRSSTVNERQAAAETLAFLADWVPAGASPMCGNSICQDRRFMARHLPDLEAYFHYRNLDVSTVKILASRWRPDLDGLSKKKPPPGAGRYPGIRRGARLLPSALSADYPRGGVVIPTSGVLSMSETRASCVRLSRVDRGRRMVRRPVPSDWLVALRSGA